MNKSEFVERVAKRCKTTKAEARRMIDAVFAEIEAAVKEARKAEKVTVPDLGTFRVAKRAARTGRNPRTGEKIRIKAGKSLRFKAASNLRKAAGC